jgi:hypothetical protein
MGQHKIENDFRNKLNQREITPSANAWDRLDAMLTVAEEKKPKPSYGWMYIAASILGFLCIGAIFFSQTEEMIDVRRNSVVIENHQKPSENTINNKPEVIVPTVTSETIAAVTEPKIKIKSNQSNSINPIKTVPETNQNQELIATSNPTPHQQTNGAIINQKSEQQITPAKVDELLANVIPTPNAGTKSIKVNSKSLLSQVDGEINLTFREKIIRKVGKNYQEVADAVSNRNTQQ